MKNRVLVVASILGMVGICCGDAVGQEATQPAQTTTQASTQEAAGAGPLQAERKEISRLIADAKKRGVGTAAFEGLQKDIEQKAAAGATEAELFHQVKRLKDALVEQNQRSTTLKNLVYQRQVQRAQRRASGGGRWQDQLIQVQQAHAARIQTDQAHRDRIQQSINAETRRNMMGR